MSTKPTQDPTTSADEDELLCDTELEALREAARLSWSNDGERVRERIPLEQVERELARVMHIELALLLVRARDLILHPLILHTPGPEGTALVRALQEEARESIGLARACGVRVPRLLVRLVAGERSTWPCASRLERWAVRLDPDVALLPQENVSSAR
jgi:hypothetical protein